MFHRVHSSKAGMAGLKVEKTAAKAAPKAASADISKKASAGAGMGNAQKKGAATAPSNHSPHIAGKRKHTAKLSQTATDDGRPSKHVKAANGQRAANSSTSAKSIAAETKSVAALNDDELVPADSIDFCSSHRVSGCMDVD